MGGGDEGQAFEELKIQLSTGQSEQDLTQTLTQIQEAVGKWNGGMSGTLSLSKALAIKLVELAVANHKDPIILAKQLRSQIDLSPWADERQAFEILKLEVLYSH